MNQGKSNRWSRRDFLSTAALAATGTFLLKAADICSLKPDQSARFLVDKGFKTEYDYAFQAMKEVPYGKWRDFDPEDTVRFYALRLHEAGMIKNSPQKILAQGTDWRFLRELKKELKA
jgi:NitT/TauT family transport system substrate-binding protein